MLSNIPSKLPLPAFTAAFSVQCDGGAMGSPDLGFNEAGAIQQPVHRAILTCSGTPSHVGAPNQPQNYLQARSMVKVTGDLWLAHVVALLGHRQGWPSPLMCWETLWECNTATIRHQHEHEIFFLKDIPSVFGTITPLPHYPGPFWAGEASISAGSMD